MSAELTAFAVERLTRAVGPSAAEAALADLGIAELDSMNALLRFAEKLIERGGAFEAVGRGLKVSALLRGARE